MSDITGNRGSVMVAETGTVQEGDPAFTDLVMEGLQIQFSSSLQDGLEGTTNTRAMAYRDRILNAAGRSKET